MTATSPTRLVARAGNEHTGRYPRSESARGRPALCRRSLRRQPALRSEGALGACLAAQGRCRRTRVAGRRGADKVHDLIGSDEALGWDTQLPNEPVINIGYTGSYLAASGHMGRSAEWRIVPVGTVGLGNYFTGVGRASTGNSAGISWTPSRVPRCAAGSMPHRPSASDPSIAGPSHSSAASRIRCHSLFPAGRHRLSGQPFCGLEPFSARARSASPHGTVPSS